MAPMRNPTGRMFFVFCLCQTYHVLFKYQRSLPNTSNDDVAAQSALYEQFELQEPDFNRNISLIKSTEYKKGNSYKNNITNHYARGLNMMNAKSGCRIASRIYIGEATKNPGRYDCAPEQYEVQGANRFLTEGDVESLLQPYETIYVHKNKVVNFCRKVLPKLKVPIVLLTGEYLVKWPVPDPHPEINDGRVQQILDHPLIIKWFIHNPPYYLRMAQGENAVLPDKIGTLPFGLQPEHYDSTQPPPMEVYREVMAQWEVLPPKQNDIYYGYLLQGTKATQHRRRIPSGPKLPLVEYLQHLAHHQYVLSPNGDRPDCYRHYEAIGLGTIPITELSPQFYGHLAEGPVVFETQKWTLTANDARQALVTGVVVNRNLVLEEYWIEYMDQLTGQELVWWDHVANSRRTLEQFALDYQGIPQLLEDLKKRAANRRKELGTEVQEQ